jgi:ketosteroid isomerase-like protein
VRTVFAAATADDLVKFHFITTPDFYAFDAGERLPGDTIMHLIKAEHAAGRNYVWTVTEPDVHVSCEVAWIAYVNQGSITDSSGTKQVKWLESAVLQRTGSGWKIRFVHSTRAR